MIKIVAAVFDVKTKVFASPFFSVSKVVATRDFVGAARDPQMILSKFPGDFELWFLADFDDETGLFSVYDKAEFAGRASDFLAGE